MGMEHLIEAHLNLLVSLQLSIDNAFPSFLNLTNVFKII